MKTENFQSKKDSTSTYGEVFSEMMESTKEVLRSEINLLSTEFKEFFPKFTKHIQQAAFFGALLVLSAIPFLAFLVIGLGELLDGRYWLSSLIVWVFCAGIGSPLYRRAMRKIATEDFQFTQTKKSLSKAFSTTKEKVEIVKSAVIKGENHYEQSTIH